MSKTVRRCARTWPKACAPCLPSWRTRRSVTLGDETLEELWPALLERVGPAQALRQALARWCMADPRPLVILIDEIDALVGDTLLAVLRQLRTGYVDRPRRFPHGIILCGLRDVRDYRIHSSAEQRLVLGGSAFNIKSESLRLGDFSEQETRALTAQHTAQTGQAFTEDALELIWERSAGQPWLVNALCYDACFRHKPGRDRGRPITAAAVLAAQERLILRRDTHIDDLAHKLREERVRRVIEPILAGADEIRCSEENLAYVLDLGLVARDPDEPPRIANPVYAEVVPRHLNHAVQIGLPQQMAWYVDAHGVLDVEALIAAFQAFFQEHSEHWVQRFEQYHEAGPQLLLQAHLQRAEAGHLIVFDRSPQRTWEQTAVRRRPAGTLRSRCGACSAITASGRPRRQPAALPEAGNGV